MSRRLVALWALVLLTLLAAPAAAQIDQRLVGVWTAQAASPLGPIQSQLILQPNGSFTRLTTDTSGHMSRMWGVWFIPAPGMLRLNVQGYAPTHYRGTAIAAPPSELVQYRVLDNNRVQTGTDMIYHRTQ
ncbi:MAG: hypothetical protein IPF99_14645 [Deltaproteobacteria bacterium]|nr:hypothetical protein [Deltaproteobacteria bacterium]